VRRCGLPGSSGALLVGRLGLLFLIVHVQGCACACAGGDRKPNLGRRKRSGHIQEWLPGRGPHWPTPDNIPGSQVSQRGATPDDSPGMACELFTCLAPLSGCHPGCCRIHPPRSNWSPFFFCSRGIAERMLGHPQHLATHAQAGVRSLSVPFPLLFRSFVRSLSAPFPFPGDCREMLGQILVTRAGTGKEGKPVNKVRGTHRSCALRSPPQCLALPLSPCRGAPLRASG